MKVEVFVNNVDEISIGINMAYGEDENGQFHLIELGFLIFSVHLINYNINRND